MDKITGKLHGRCKCDALASIKEVRFTYPERKRPL